MTVSNESRRLMELLDVQLFQPLATSNPDSFAPHQRDAITELRQHIAQLRRDLAAAGSPSAIVRQFDEFVRSHAASLDPSLADLGFVTLSDLRYDVDKLAAELGPEVMDVSSGGSAGPTQTA